jgi:hypothetical protein
MTAHTTITIPRIGADWPEQGGIFLGMVACPYGQHDYLLILEPEAQEKLDHPAALEWARGLRLHGFNDWGLPNLNDGPVAYGNGRAHIEPAWHWLSDHHAAYVEFAWRLNFNSGKQNFHLKNDEIMARAIRRVLIK